MACRIAISLAAATMGISLIGSDASAACKLKAKKDIIVILDVGHSDKDSGQISARGLKEYDFNMNLARRVLEELVNTGFVSTQMMVTSGPNNHASRLQRSKRANDHGHHGSHNATPKQHGLEMMTSPDLSAFIPTNEQDAKKVRWGEMPFKPILEDLKKRTNKRVIRADDPWLAEADGKPSYGHPSGAILATRHGNDGLWVELDLA